VNTSGTETEIAENMDVLIKVLLIPIFSIAVPESPRVS
jgi:hypothetical protein